MRRKLDLNELREVTGGMTADDPIVKITVKWEDAAGNQYTYTRENRPAPDIIDMYATWEDGAGNRYSTGRAN